MRAACSVIAAWTSAGCCLLPLLAPPARAAGTDRQVAVTAAGRPLVEIAVQGQAVRIAGAPGEAVLLGAPYGADKRKYRVEGGAAVAEVKLKPEVPGQEPAGFKLRAPDGKLLWKVKIAADKIKISADEDGAHPFVLSLKHADKIKVLDGDGHELGGIKLKDRVVVEDAGGHERFVATLTGARSALLGVLLMEAIPVRERWILMAEILAAGY